MARVKQALGVLVLILIAALVFGVMIFPYGDLSGLLSKTALENGNVWIQSRDLRLSLFPTPGVEATGVTIEPTGAGPIKILELERLTVRPLLSALLAFKQGLSVSGTGLWDGSFAASATMNSAAKEAPPNSIGQLAITGFEVKDVSVDRLAQEFIKLGVKLNAKLGIDTASLVMDLVQVGPQVVPQNPLGDINVTLDNLGPFSNASLGAFGDLAFPPVKISKAVLNLKADKTRLQIRNGTIGSGKDPIQGRVLGDVALQFTPAGANLGSFVYCLELTFAEAFLKATREELKSTILEDFLNSYRLASSQGGNITIGIRESGPSFLAYLGEQRLPQKGDCTGLAAPQ